MERILNQIEIDELIRAVSDGTINEWKTKYILMAKNNTRFKSNEVFKVDNHDAFRCEYALEELSSNISVVRRYAYGDCESFKRYKFFMVLEDYKEQGSNMVTAVGIEAEKYELNYDYSLARNRGRVFLIEADALKTAYKL